MDTGKNKGLDQDDVPEVSMEPIEQIDIIKKILVIGDSGVGKKTILSKVAPFKQEWERYTKTIGTAITKYIRSYSFVTADVNLLIIVWDITGQDDYKRMTPSYYKGAEALCVMADANDEPSILNIPNWIKAAYKITDMVPTIAIINKIDLIPENERKRLDRMVKKVMMGYEIPIYYVTKDAEVSDLEVPFFKLAEMLKERIKLQLAKKRFKKSRLTQQ